MGLGNYINLKNIICSPSGNIKPSAAPRALYCPRGSKLYFLGLYNYLDPWFYTLYIKAKGVKRYFEINLARFKLIFFDQAVYPALGRIGEEPLSSYFPSPRGLSDITSPPLGMVPPGFEPAPLQPVDRGLMPNSPLTESPYQIWV